MSDRETFGPRLRIERERRGISLETIASVTKVGADLWEGLERNDFSPAPSMVTREVQAQVENFKQQLRQQGLTLRQLGTNEQQMAENMRPQATFNVKAFLLLEAIRTTEGLDVSEEEIDAEIKQMAEEKGQNPARLRATMEKNQQLLLLRAQMREDEPGVPVDVPLGVVLGGLCDPAHRLDLGEDRPQHPGVPEEVVGVFPARMDEHLLELVADALGAHLDDRAGVRHERLPGRALDGEPDGGR